ncbi:MAG TPA: 3,4-dihydroxy-2-butanone-4-phosphate synthase, partial [Syntrophomonas sp.]|nr:3,4-dihydroxy-2-butanone-4-phosphate synthase [Syntrophomonas sp.]
MTFVFTVFIIHQNNHLLVDDEDRENEGDIIIAAEKCSPEKVNFMASYAKGLICMPMTGERLDQLDIQAMVLENT